MIVGESGLVDINLASGGAFAAATDELIPVLDQVRAWYSSQQPAATDPRTQADLEADPSVLDAPLQHPAQIFAVGLNYSSHIAEVNMEVPASPMIFTKFPSSLTGPGATIPLPTATVDWEVELVAVIGKGGRDITEDEALGAICAYCVGQDISERTGQFADSPAQFCMAKSHRGFSPIGPWLTTADELANPQNLAIGCALDGETMQDANTSMMLFNLPRLIAYLSSICDLYAGDIIFTGTPDGIGLSKNPPRFIQPGETLMSHIETLGSLKNRFVQDNY